MTNKKEIVANIRKDWQQRFRETEPIGLESWIDTVVSSATLATIERVKHDAFIYQQDLEKIECFSAEEYAERTGKLEASIHHRASLTRIEEEIR